MVSIYFWSLAYWMSSFVQRWKYDWLSVNICISLFKRKKNRTNLIWGFLFIFFTFSEVKNLLNGGFGQRHIHHSVIVKWIDLSLQLHHFKLTYKQAHLCNPLQDWIIGISDWQHEIHCVYTCEIWHSTCQTQGLTRIHAVRGQLCTLQRGSESMNADPLR